MTLVAEWVRSLVADAALLLTHPFAVGDTVEHPKHGRVKIVGGQYWGKYGLSNFWDWRKVDQAGKPYGRTFCGYGWNPGEKS